MDSTNLFTSVGYLHVYLLRLSLNLYLPISSIHCNSVTEIQKKNEKNFINIFLSEKKNCLQFIFCLFL